MTTNNHLLDRGPRSDDLAEKGFADVPAHLGDEQAHAGLTGNRDARTRAVDERDLALRRVSPASRSRLPANEAAAPARSAQALVAASSTRARSRVRARESRDFTVPSGMPSAAAVSSLLSSRK